MTAPAPLTGLTEDEACERRIRGLSNIAPFPTSRSYTQILRANVFTFINITLIVIGTLLLLLGQMSDAIATTAIVLVNPAIGAVQEIRAKCTLDRIALLTRPQATIVREGEYREIDPAEVVLGDVLVARPGETIAVDGRLLDTRGLEIDESLLTGESDPARKRQGDTLYAGSVCVAGSAFYEATVVGSGNLANRMIASARAFRQVSTPLQRDIDIVVRVLTLVAACYGFLLAVGAIIDRLSIVEGVQVAAVIASLIPNGLVFMNTAAYAMGAVRMAGRGILIQQANAVESLSNVDVLCLDKTGTLTSNRLVMRQVIPLTDLDREITALLGDFAASVTTSNRTSEAIHAAVGGQRRMICGEVPFSSARKWSALTFADTDRHGTYLLGAPEILAPSDHDVAARVAPLDATGLRVLLLARAPEPLPLHDFADDGAVPADVVPIGLVALADELRPEANTTLASFRQAGIQIKLISGDHPRTVAALARQAGFIASTPPLSGQDLASMGEAQLAQAAETTAIFGRVTPEQKAQLVHALRRNGHCVAMIGDGVNDVLALKAANLGIALHDGSSAARAVSDMILLNDSFASLPRAFQEGQRILNGMRDCLKLLLTRLLYTALVILAVGVAGGGFPFVPKHTAILALLTVGIPTFALVAWAQPSPQPRRRMLHSILPFVVPATLMLTLLAFVVYMGYLLGHYWRNLGAMSGSDALDAAVPVAQSALTTATLLGGLLLILFLHPPTPRWTAIETVSGARRPALLTAVLFLGYIGILAFGSLRTFFGLTGLSWADYFVICGVVALWGQLLRWGWRARVMDRVLHIDLH
jgi:cation-transporting ATPase E